MMKTLNLSGFKAGDSLNISVSQGAITAGPINAPSWGVTNTGGTITISTDRSNLQCAPDSVRFSVDLSASTFDTPGPVAPSPYDPRLHDLIYLWDFDDAVSGDWSAPVNVLPSWKNRNTAKGPWVAHCYTRPGTYNPSVLVIEPSSGKTATAVLAGMNAVEILNPDDVYPGAQTICVNPVGDTDFSGKPPGAAEINLDELLTTSTEWTSRRGGTPKRWLFKPGVTYHVGVRMASEDTPGHLFGAYGASGKAIIRAKIGQNFASTAFTTTSAMAGGDMRWSRLSFQDDYDPTTQNQSIDKSGYSGVAIWNTAPHDTVISECDFDGFASSSVINSDYPVGAKVHLQMDDCTVTNFGGMFPVMTGACTHVLSSNSFTGCRLSQTSGAVNDPGIRAPIRMNYARFQHVRGLDIYHTDGSQPCLKVSEGSRDDLAVINIHSCAFEGGLEQIQVNGNTSTSLGRAPTQNAIFDGCILVGDHSAQSSIRCVGTGITFRNMLIIMPRSELLPTDDFYVAFFNIATTGDPPDYVKSAPIKIYNCTMRMERTSVQNGGRDDPRPVYQLEVGSGYTGVSEWNNVTHQPNVTNASTPFIPLSEDTLWTPRCIGNRDRTTMLLDTNYATLTDAVKDSKPGTGSAALGTALTGNVSYMDILGTTRTAPADKGAWEVA